MTVRARTKALMAEVHSQKGTGKYSYADLKIIELLAILIEAVEKGD